MSSSDTAGTPGAYTAPMISTQLSSGTFPPSLSAAQLETYRSDYIETQKQRARSALSWLGCVEGPPLFPYAQSADFQKRKNVVFLCVLLGSVWYIPKSVPADRIQTALSRYVDQDDHSELLKKELYALWLSTAHEKTAEADRNAKLALYYDRLKLYPIEAVVLALRTKAFTSRFFPTYAEVLDSVKSILVTQDILLAALLHRKDQLT